MTAPNQGNFAPSVMIDGVSYEPEGWMWILAFAMRGIPWAVEMAMSPEFDMDGKVRDYQQRRRRYFNEREAGRVEQQIEDLKRRLADLKSNL